jgi:DNA topoisomerase I
MSVHLHVYHDDGEWHEELHPRVRSGSHGGEFAKGNTASAGKSTKPVQRAGQLQSVPKEQWPEHIQKLKIPPAWTDVQVNPDPNGDLLAIGKDAKGRKQYVYSERFANSQSAQKFSRIKQMAEDFGHYQAINQHNLESNNEKLREHAACLSLIMSMGVRPGSERDTGAEKQAYGATTLEGRHVVRHERQTYLEFVGKKGVSLKLPVVDENLAKTLQERASTAGKDGKLFPNVSDSTLRDYTHRVTNGLGKTKDFRTLLGTSLALKLVSKAPPPKDEKGYKRSVMEVAKVVSKVLGNTAAVSLKSYISPYVFSDWKAA